MITKRSVLNLKSQVNLKSHDKLNYFDQSYDVIVSNSAQHNKLCFTHLSTAVTIHHLNSIRLSCDSMLHTHHSAKRSTSNQCFNVVFGSHSSIKFCLITLALTTKVTTDSAIANKIYDSTCISSYKCT